MVVENVSTASSGRATVTPQRTTPTGGAAPTALSPRSDRALENESGPTDRIDISDAARRLRDEDEAESSSPLELSPEDEQRVRDLKARDAEVRQHEQAHLAAAGDLASGGPTYTYETGPDGRRYAVGGEVQIQLREGGDPQETLENARRAKRAALAPAEPSAQDRRVAAKADALAQQAQRDIAQQRVGGESDGEPTAADREATPPGSLLNIVA